jgi:hypothetical protein
MINMSISRDGWQGAHPLYEGDDDNSDIYEEVFEEVLK